MTPQSGYYSLIQYCPDRGRAEVANIGVLLCCPSESFLEVKMSPDNSRAIRFFGAGLDEERFNVVKSAFLSRFQREKGYLGGRGLVDGPISINVFASTLANEIVMTDARPMKVLDPERDLSELFDHLVEK